MVGQVRDAPDHSGELNGVPRIQNETTRVAVRAVNQLGKQAREDSIHFGCIHSELYYLNADRHPWEKR